MSSDLVQFFMEANFLGFQFLGEFPDHAGSKGATCWEIEVSSSHPPHSILCFLWCNQHALFVASFLNFLEKPQSTVLHLPSLLQVLFHLVPVPLAVWLHESDYVLNNARVITEIKLYMAPGFWISVFTCQRISWQWQGFILQNIFQHSSHDPWSLCSVIDPFLKVSSQSVLGDASHMWSLVIDFWFNY